MAPTGERILVVEDDPDISELIAREALEPLGYEVTIVGLAATAIDEALENPPDLIIANLDLPDLGGNDLLTAMSSQGVTAPTVMIARRGDEHRAIQAFRLGAADVLLWPARDAEVVRVVERAIQPTRSRRIRRQLYQQLEAAQERLQRRDADLGAIVAISRALSSGAEQPVLLDRLLGIALQISGADVAWLTLRDDKTRDFVLRAQRNLPAAWARKTNQPLDDGLSSTVARSGRALTIHGLPLEGFKAAALGKSAAVLPVKVRGQVLGVLIVLRKADVEFDRLSQALLEVVADFAAISLLNHGMLRGLEVASAAARRAETNRKSVLETVQASIDALRAIQSGEVGELTQDQKTAVHGVRVSLERSLRAAEKTRETE
jgi:DNA-binding response OmpR family regulator